MRLAQPEDGIASAGPSRKSFRDDGARYAFGSLPVFGPAASYGQVAPAHRALAQGMEQAAPALTIRSGEGALGRAVGLDRHGSAPVPVPVDAVDAVDARWRRQAHWRRSGHCPQSGRAAVQTVAPRSNIDWLNSHDSPAGTRWSPSAIASRTVSGAPATAREDTHAVGVDRGHVVPEGEGAYCPRRIGPDAGQRGNSASSSGTLPSWSALIATAARCRFSARRL